MDNESAVGTMCVYIYIYMYECIYVCMYVYNSHHVMRIEKGTFENIAIYNFKSMRRMNIMLNVK